MEIVVLIEDGAGANERLQHEHGLSLLVFAHGRRVLFDSGATGAAVANADALGLGDDLARLDAIVLSHGHVDHSGGLAAVLARTRRLIPVHVCPGFFRPRISTRGGKPRPVGVPLSQHDLETRGARIIERAEPQQLLPGVWLSGAIPLREETTPIGSALYSGNSPADATLETFADEQAMAIATSKGLTVLVGCGHRGLVNSIVAAQAAGGGGPVHAVLGGAHLHAADEARIASSIARARGLVSRAALGHCTGRAIEARFAAAFGADFQPLRTGWRCRIA